LSKDDRIARWNRRFSHGEETHDFVPSPLLSRALGYLTPGRALDIACGAGRHAIFLAEHGWQVVAVDGSRVGIDLMMTEAGRRGCRERIEVHEADLESDPPGFSIEADGYDLIADFYFLHRPLFGAVRRGLRPGGVFVAAIHVESPDAERPHRFLLKPGELERTVRGWGWRVLHFLEVKPSESGHSRHAALLVAQRP